MLCPMTFNNPCYEPIEECREGCAWRIECSAGTVCAVALLAASHIDNTCFFNKSKINTVEGDEDDRT